MTKRFSLTMLGVAVFMAAMIPQSAHAQSKPIQLSLLTPVQIFPESAPIAGIRLNLLYGRNVSVHGLDVGLVNHTTTGHFKGAQFGVVGIADADFDGFQDNWVNIVKGKITGFQWGAVNHAVSASGFQLGLVNYAGTMHGLQIGLVNIIGQGGAFPVFPIVNWSF
jgi:hypothetical protein